MGKIKDFFVRRKELFTAALRFGILNYLVFAAIGLYCRTQTYISEITFSGELYTIFLFLGIPGALALILALITAIGACGNKISMRIFGCFTGIICTIFLVIDAIVFSQYKFHIDSAMLALFFSDAGTELIPFSWGMFLMGGGGILVIAALICILMYIAEKITNANFTKIARIMVCFFIAGFLIYHGWHAFSTFKGDQIILERNQIFPGNFGLSAKRFLTSLGFKNNANLKMKEKYGAFYYPLSPVKFRQNAPKYNIVFVIVDSLRGDMITPEVMPYLSRFANEGSYFCNHFSNGNCTRTGMFALFSGIYGTYWHKALSAGRGSVLVDSCVERGFETGIFFSAALTNPEFDRTIFSRIKGMTLKRNGKNKVERDYEAVKDFKDFVQKRDKSKPTFAVIMYDSLHGYLVPPDFKVPFENAYDTMNYLILKKNDPTQKKKVFNMIRNATAFIDTQLQSMMEFLKKEYDWDNTIFVITSDHGNECNESDNNIWGHNSKFSRYQLHVPLIIAGGPVPKGIFDHRTYHVDVVPTLMQLLGCTTPIQNYSTGRSLWKTEKRDLMIFSSYSNRAMIYNDAIYEMNRNGVTYNYDLKGKKIKQLPSASQLKQFFDEMSRFTR